MPKHHTRHKNTKRHVIDYLLAGIIAAAIFSLCTILYYRYAVFAQNVMSDSVSASEYYEEQYDKFERELDLFLGSIGVPSSVVSDGQDLQSWYYFELRKRVLTENREGTLEKSIQDKIETPVRTYLSENNIGLSGEAEAGFESMLKSLESNLSQELDHPDIRTWYGERDAFTEKSSLSMGIAALAAVLAAGILFTIQHYKYRTLHYAGIGCLLGGVCGAGYVLFQYLRLNGAEPVDGALQSIQLFIKNITLTGAMIPAAACAVGILLIAGGRLIQRQSASR